MNEYAVYCFINGSRLVAAEKIEAENDEAVLKLAAKIRRGVWREIWLGDRLVGSIEVDPEQD